MVENKETEKHSVEKKAIEEKNSKANFSKIKENPWMPASVILGIVVLTLLAMIFVKPGQVSGAVAGNNVVEFAKAQGLSAEVVKVSDKGSFYEVQLSMEGQNFPVYVTKDGKSMATGLIPLEIGNLNNSSNQNPAGSAPTEVPKSDKPKVELFVMTHCPYGLQAEKGMIPVFKLLGNKIDAKIRFVHYFMHGDKEEKETYNQVCIREEQNAKYLPYLECFIEKGDSEGCISKVGIDKTKLNNCLANDNKKAKEYYEKDKELSQNYGVAGSPTLIINGVEAGSARDSESFLKTVCSSFNNAPEECNKQLSSTNPSPGFGTSSSGGSSSQDQCL